MQPELVFLCIKEKDSAMIIPEEECHVCKGGEDEGSVWGLTRLSWPDNFLTTLRDENGVFFGYKSTTLESVGVLLPLLVFHERLMGRNIVIMIDNMAVVYGWPKGLVKNDKTASEVLKAAHYLSCFLGVTIHVHSRPLHV